MVANLLTALTFLKIATLYFFELLMIASFTVV